MSISSRFNEIVLYFNRYEPTQINNITLLNKINISKKILKEIAYPHTLIKIKYQIEPTTNIFFEEEYKNKKGYFSVRDILNKIINFYNKPLTELEISYIKYYGLKKNIKKLKKLSFNKQRSYYIYSNLFKGFKKIGEHTFELLFVNS